MKQSILFTILPIALLLMSCNDNVGKTEVKPEASKNTEISANINSTKEKEVAQTQDKITEAKTWFLDKLNRHTKTDKFGIFTLTDFKYSISENNLVVTHNEKRNSDIIPCDCFVTWTIPLKYITEIVSEEKDNIVFRTKKNAIKINETCKCFNKAMNRKEDDNKEKYETNNYVKFDVDAEENLVERISKALEDIKSSIDSKEAY